MKFKESLCAILAVLLVVVMIIGAIGWSLFFDVTVSRNRKDAQALIYFSDYLPGGQLFFAAEGNYSRYSDAASTADRAARFLTIACDCTPFYAGGLYRDLIETNLFFNYNKSWDVFWALFFGNYTQDHLDYLTEARYIMQDIHNVLVVIEVDGTDPMDQLGSDRIEEIAGYAEQLRNLDD